MRRSDRSPSCRNSQRPRLASHRELAEYPRLGTAFALLLLEPLPLIVTAFFLLWCPRPDSNRDGC
jgi:hypothetical protein